MNKKSTTKLGERAYISRIEKKLLNAIRMDIDALANKFCKEKTKDLAFFVKLFNEVEFSTVFLGRLSISDLVEVSYFAFFFLINFFLVLRNFANVFGQFYVQRY